MDGIVKEVKSAVDTLKQKYVPLAKPIHLPEDKYKSIFDMLEIWDRNRENEDIQTKTKYIYNTLEEQGNPSDLLVGLFTKLGALPMGEVKVDRVYRYLKLCAQGKRVFNHYENIQKEIKAIEKTEEKVDG